MFSDSLASTARATCVLALICTLGAAAFGQAPAAAERRARNAAEDAGEKAPTVGEAKAAFAKADRALNQAWSAAKQAVEGRAFGQLTLSQREWLEFRDERAKQESELAGEKDAKRSAIWHTTAAALTESRAEWLRGRAEAAKEPAETLTGLWTDSYGGTMYVVHQAGPVGDSGAAGVGRLLFAIEVVRGPTYHTGATSGVATWNQPLGWWSDKGRDQEKPDESNLAFADREGCVEVIGANTGYYHGARAYFDGVYCKVEPLDEKTQAEVIKAAESGQPLLDDEQEEGSGG